MISHDLVALAFVAILGVGIGAIFGYRLGYAEGRLKGRIEALLNLQQPEKSVEEIKE